MSCDAPSPDVRWAARRAMSAGSGALSARLPDFPWNALTPYVEMANAHPDGVVDLSVGTPVDPTPDFVRRALETASDAHGYPVTAGSPRLRESMAGWLDRRLGVQVDSGDVLPVIGSKEFVAWLPTMLGLGASDTVVIPELAYPTYAVGVEIAGARIVRADSTMAMGPAPVAMVWINSPANPTGRVLPVDHLRKVVAWARERGALVVSDECYIELSWSDDPAEQPMSALHPSVCGDSTDGVIAIHSLSKRSNMAGYRLGFVAGDSSVIASLLEVRKHAGMIVAAPIQAAGVAAYDDDDHVEMQRDRYRARRELLRTALIEAGFRVDHSEAALYLWATREERCWDTVDWLARRGILVAPGEFYGPNGNAHVRVALTATDERVSSAASRLRLA